MTQARTRPAEPADADEIARIQLLTWRVAYADLLPQPVLDSLDEDDTSRAWTETMRTGAATVYVASEDATVVGFCVAGMPPEQELAAADGGLPDDAGEVGMVATLLVEPRWGRRGHGGRLLASAAEALRGEGATRGIAWVPEADDASLAFFGSVGWESDGTVRTLDAGGRPLREVRLTGTLALRLE